MGLYEVPLSVSGFGIGTMLAIMCSSISRAIALFRSSCVVSVILYPCMLCLGVVAILLLNVMEVFSVCGGALLDRPCMAFQRVCVLCL